MTDQVTTPARLSHDAGPAEMREYLLRLDTWLQAREPVADGSALTKFITGEAMVNSGLLSFRTGVSGVPTTDELVPGEASTSPADESQPTPASGLTVTPGVGFFFVEIDAPIYRQGGGNGRTLIYRANYSGAGPLPTFGNAVEVFAIPGASIIAVVDAEPGVQAHFWAKAETRHPTLQANPTGGTNGVSATAGLIDGSTNIANASITNAKIVSLSVAKLTAGSIAVGEYAQSTGFVTGSSGWQIKGDGTAEFSGVIVRGTIYASAGTIGGINIGADYIRSTNFVAGVSGWRLKDDGSAEFDAATIRGTLTTAQIQVGAATGSSAATYTSSSIAITAGDFDKSSGVQSVLTYSSTGKPVLLGGYVSIFAILNDTNCEWFNVTVETKIDGVTHETQTSVHYAKQIAGGTLIEQSIPIQLLNTPLAGSHSYDYEITLEWRDATNAGFASTGGGSIITGGYFSVLELKV